MRADVPDRWSRPVFLASMGRSGSTLLQRLLNVHPEITIWGEHGGFLSGILSSYSTANHEATVKNLAEGFEHRHTVIGELSEKDAFKPWVSPFKSEDLSAVVQSLLIEMFTKGLSPSIRWGFKEIRYTDAELSELMAIFPEARLVILARDLPGYATSRFFAFGNTDFDLDSDEGRQAATQNLTKMMNGWINRYEGLLRVHERFADRCSLVAYPDLVVGSERPARLFEELGELVPRGEAIEAVLGAKAGSSFKFNSAARSNREKLGELIESADVDRARSAAISERFGIS